MHFFEFIFALVAMVLLFKLVSSSMRQRHLAPRDDAVNAELVQRLSQVEERVRVLERIVTDERFDLKQQFKDLEA
jgi:hypothetical protein